MKTIIYARALIRHGDRMLVNLTSNGEAKMFGGKVKKNERVRAALARELAEELELKEPPYMELVSVLESFPKNKKLRILQFVYDVDVRPADIVVRVDKFTPRWVPIPDEWRPADHSPMN